MQNLNKRVSELVFLLFVQGLKRNIIDFFRGILLEGGGLTLKRRWYFL
jgi:hypothetical protein